MGNFESGRGRILHGFLLRIGIEMDNLRKA